jgi:hypothetical protein
MGKLAIWRSAELKTIFSVRYLVSYTVTCSVFLQVKVYFIPYRKVLKIGESPTQFGAQTVFRGVLQTDFNKEAYGEFVQ